MLDSASSYASSRWRQAPRAGVDTYFYGLCWSNARSIALARNRVGDDVELGTLDEATFSRLYGAVPVASVHKSNCRGASLNRGLHAIDATPA